MLKIEVLSKRDIKYLMTKENLAEKWITQKNSKLIKTFEGLHYLFQKTLNEHRLDKANLWTGRSFNNQKIKVYIDCNFCIEENIIYHSDDDLQGYTKALKDINQYIKKHEHIIDEQIAIKTAETSEYDQMAFAITSNSTVAETLSNFFPRH